MKLPPGITSSKPIQVCKLIKSLYGLKQASCKWHEKLTSLLVAQHYKQANSDHSLFTAEIGNNFTLLLVYVDDIILAGNSMTEFDHIKSVLHKSFQIKNLGHFKYFLGLEVAHSSKGITLCQQEYCLDLLTDTWFLGSKPMSTSSYPTIKLHNDLSLAYTDISVYIRLVGQLLYLIAIRPYITFIT